MTGYALYLTGYDNIIIRLYIDVDEKEDPEHEGPFCDAQLQRGGHHWPQCTRWPQEVDQRTA